MGGEEMSSGNPQHLGHGQSRLQSAASQLLTGPHTDYWTGKFFYCYLSNSHLHVNLF